MNQLRTCESRSAFLQGIATSLGCRSTHLRDLGLRSTWTWASQGIWKASSLKIWQQLTSTKIALHLCRWISKILFKVSCSQTLLDRLWESFSPTEPTFGEFIIHGVKTGNTHMSLISYTLTTGSCLNFPQGWRHCPLQLSPCCSLSFACSPSWHYWSIT